MVLDTWHLFTTGVADIAAGLALYLVFDGLRLWKRTAKFFAPRRFFDNDGDRALHPAYVPAYRLPPDPPKSVLALFWTLCWISEEELLETSGPDALVHFRLLNFGLQVSFVLSVVNLAICLPLNLAGGVVDTALATTSGASTDVQISDLDKTSMANIAEGSSTMYGHVLAAWVSSLYVLSRLWVAHRAAVSLRVRYLVNTRRGAASHTVLVTDIPGVAAGTYAHRIMQVTTGPFGWWIPSSVKASARKNLTELVGATSAKAAELKGRLMRRLSSSIGPGRASGSPPPLPSLPDGIQEDLRGGAPDSAAPVPGKGDPEGGVDESAFLVVQPEEITDMTPWETARDRRALGGVANIVRAEFEGTYAGQVVSVINVPDQSTVTPRLAAYEATRQAIEDLTQSYMAKLYAKAFVPHRHRKRVTLRLALEPSWVKAKYTALADGKATVSVDLLDFLCAKLDEDLAALKSAVDEVRVTDAFSPSAFVTLRTRMLQTSASNAKHHHVPGVWHCEQAPDPSDVVWENLQWRQWERKARTWGMWAAFAFLLMVYLVPVTLLQGLINVLPTAVPAVFDIPVVGGLLLGIVPSGALTIVIALAPGIFRSMRFRQGLPARSAIEYGASDMVYLFQYLVVFLGNLLVGAFTTNITANIGDNAALDNPDLLGAGVAQSATFFITFLLLRGTVISALQAIRIPELLVYWSKLSVSVTAAARARAWQIQRIFVAPHIAPHTIAILIGLAYAQIQPLMMPVLLIYFVFFSLTWRYNLLYVYTEAFQTGGKLWPSVSNQLMFGVLSSQLVLAAYLGVKRFPYASLLAPLPVVTAVLWARMARDAGRVMRCLSMRAAADLDRHDRETVGAVEGMTPEEIQEMKSLYTPPAFAVTDADHAAVKAQAALCTGYIEGGSLPPQDSDDGLSLGKNA